MRSIALLFLVFGVQLFSIAQADTLHPKPSHPQHFFISYGAGIGMFNDLTAGVAITAGHQFYARKESFYRPGIELRYAGLSIHPIGLLVAFQTPAIGYTQQFHFKKGWNIETSTDLAYLAWLELNFLDSSFNPALINQIRFGKERIFWGVEWIKQFTQDSHADTWSAFHITCSFRLRK